MLFKIVSKGYSLLKSFLLLPTSPYLAYILFEPFFRVIGRRNYTRDIELFQIKRVIVVRIDHIGDVVMTSPFLRELRLNFPNALITLIVLPTAFNLVEHCPYVNEVVACDWTGDRDLHRYHRYWGALKMAKNKLYPKQFDLAILPRRGADQSHGTFLAYFSGAPIRVGYSDSVFGQKLPNFRKTDQLLTHVLESQKFKHEVEHGLDLITYIGGNIQSDKMEVWLSAEDESFAEQILKYHNVYANELLIGFALGAAHPKRIWPLSNFAAIIGWLKEEYHARILLLGGHGEERMAHELRQQLKDEVINTVGQTTLRQAAAILKCCHLYVGNDSGLMHLAAAAGVSVVEISCHSENGLPSHPNSPMRFGPWGESHRIVQPQKAIPPCSDACMAKEAHCICNVTVDQVKEAISYIFYNQGQSKVH